MNIADCLAQIIILPFVFIIYGFGYQLQVIDDKNGWKKMNRFQKIGGETMMLAMVLYWFFLVFKVLYFGITFLQKVI